MDLQFGEVGFFQQLDPLLNARGHWRGGLYERDPHRQRRIAQGDAGEREADRVAERIDETVDLAAEPAARAAQSLWVVFFLAPAACLVGAHDGAVKPDSMVWRSAIKHCILGALKHCRRESV